MLQMNITSYLVSSCAASAIADLGRHTDAVDAMMTFCSKEFGNFSFNSKFLAPHYAFVAGPEISGKGHSKRWVKYGTEFAQLIKDNNLGTVVTCGPITNYKFHPDTTCQMWIWQPDTKAVEAWWKAQQAKKNVAPKKGIVRKSKKKEEV